VCPDGPFDEVAGGSEDFLDDLREFKHLSVVSTLQSIEGREDRLPARLPHLGPL